MKTYTQGIYEGLKLALKIVKLFENKKNIIEHIEAHLLILNSKKFTDEKKG